MASVQRAAQARLAQDLDHAFAPTRRSDRHPALFGIVFAPDDGLHVFLREDRLVAERLRRRFDAEARVVELVNQTDTISALPWATPRNLQRAISAAARRMDREHDVLFLHFTSHGAGDGTLSAQMHGLDVDGVTPAQVRRWLDEAGVRWRVVSVSACYAGTWVPVLRDERTLVMTASDATHTSQGCGHDSPLTYYGRALFEQQLATTHDLERAFAGARDAIALRERAEKRDDGGANPQIAMGEAIRPVLQRLAERLDR